MKFIISFILIWLVSVQLYAEDFFGYYTRLDYTIPIHEAEYYIPTDLTEESQLIMERIEALARAAMDGEEDDDDEYEHDMDTELEFMEFEDLPEVVRAEARRQFPDQPLMGVELERDDGEVFYHVMFEVEGTEAGLRMNQQGDILDTWHFDEEGDEDEDNEEEDEEDEDEDDSPRRRRRNHSDKLAGRFADVVVQIADGQQLIFGRKSAYQPKWQTAEKAWPIKDLVERQFDVGCLYSYARIIENSPTRITVHWRYMPDLENVGLTSVVHELFSITPDGVVERRVRQACTDLDDWNDPANVTIQKLKLSAEGVKELSLKPAKLSRLSKEPVSGSSVRPNTVAQVAALWQFDEGLEPRPYKKKDVTKEGKLGSDCSVQGDVTLWKQGVSGTALAFDGYQSSVVCPASQTPKINDELSVEAWVVLGALPWNWAPLVHQSFVDPGPIEKGNYDEYGKTDERKPGKGYYLGVDAHGYPLFTINGQVLQGNVQLEPYRWTHVAASYGNGAMTLYVDGQPCGTMQASGEIEVPETDLLIGLNNMPGRATDPIREPICHLARIYGIEGLIDEVRIYDQALSAEQIANSYQNLKPSDQLRDNPDLPKRTLPGRPGFAKNFGATYTDLGYHELWNIIWRESDYPDILVKFDTTPASVAFWRGVNGGVGWVTENNKWMSDQSLETGGPHGCSEHMSDKENRHAHVRLIENTDARVVVHWRYASIDIDYVFPSIRHWTDEYYCVYPDCVAVRKVNYRNGEGGWHDVQFLNEPGTSPRDNIDWQALDVANLDGEVHKLTWEEPDGVPQNPLRDACISMVNLKSKYKVFLIYPGEGIGTWGADEQSPHTPDPFAGPWNHWPVSQIRSDGRYAISNDRLTHAALGGGDTHGNMAMYGLTDKPITELVPLARMWKNPPAIENTQGCKSEGYQMAERAYHLSADQNTMSFSVEADEGSPLVNPCFVVKNWQGQRKASLRINGKEMPVGKQFRQGLVRDTQGEPMLVTWIEMRTTEPTTIEFTVSED